MLMFFISGKKKDGKKLEKLIKFKKKNHLQLFKWDRFKRIFKVKDSRECMNY